MSNPAAPIARFVIEKELSINNLSKKRQELLDFVGQEGLQIAELELRSMQSLDLAGVQAVLALRKSAEERGVELRLVLDLDEPLQRMLANAGIRLG